MLKRRDCRCELPNTYTRVSVDFSKVDVGGTEIQRRTMISILDTNGNVVKDSNGRQLHWESRRTSHIRLPDLRQIRLIGCMKLQLDGGYSVVTDVEFNRKRRRNSFYNEFS